MHRVEDLGWTNYCYEQLKYHVPLSPPTFRKVTDTRLRKGYSESYIVQSRTDEVITNLYRLWYPNEKKVLPFDFIESYLDNQALAWWYQDDGHLKIVNGVMTKIILSTDGFTVEENNRLAQLLSKKFKLHFHMDQQNRLILYDQFQIIYFLHLVSPCLHTSMSRKSMIEQPLRSIAKRTTIYLPKTILLSRPTSEINGRLKNLNNLLYNSDENICIPTIFETFLLILTKRDDDKAYQIIIDASHRQKLAKIRQQTGLTISQLTEYCFTI